MKIVIAPDSFKDSLDAAGVARAIALGLSEALPTAELVECPMADGGEGTMEAIVAANVLMLSVRAFELAPAPENASVNAFFRVLSAPPSVLDMSSASPWVLYRIDSRMKP